MDNIINPYNSKTIDYTNSGCNIIYSEYTATNYCGYTYTNKVY